MHPQRILPLLAITLMAQTAFAQDSVATHVARGDSAYAAFEVETALQQYEAAIAADSSNVDALGKASRTAVDIGESLTDAARKKELFLRTALSVGVRDRVKYAVAIKQYAQKTLALKPDHAGALHVLGMWNAEVKRLNGVSLFFARNFLGGGVMGQANWKDAVSYMERAAEVDPDRLVHRLDLAGVYASVGEKEKARTTYESVISATTRTDFNDPLYRKQAEEALKKLR
jgi:tetratricopeptide (TPR) repeat protein